MEKCPRCGMPEKSNRELVKMEYECRSIVHDFTDIFNESAACAEIQRLKSENSELRERCGAGRRLAYLVENHSAENAAKNWEGFKQYATEAQWRKLMESDPLSGGERARVGEIASDLDESYCGDDSEAIAVAVKALRAIAAAREGSPCDGCKGTEYTDPCPCGGCKEGSHRIPGGKADGQR